MSRFMQTATTRVSTSVVRVCYQFGRSLNPDFTGAADERGAGAGLGFNHNFPISRRACTDEVYCDTLQQAAEVIKKHTTHYLIVR